MSSKKVKQRAVRVSGEASRERCEDENSRVDKAFQHELLAACKGSEARRRSALKFLMVDHEVYVGDIISGLLTTFPKEGEKKGTRDTDFIKEKMREVRIKQGKIQLVDYRSMAVA